MFKSVKISDLFIPQGGNGLYTKDYCNNNRGEYPVYSSDNESSFGNINQYDYDGNYLTWSIVGCAGFITELNGKFSITNNRGILKPKDNIKNINLSYIMNLIEPIFRKHKKGRLGINGKNEYTTLNATAINNIKDEILIPIDSDGNFDLEKQREIALKYKEIENKKQILLNKIEQLKKLKIEVNRNCCNTVELEFNKMFELKRGKIISKNDLREDRGDNPVYSTQKGVFGHINSYMQDGKYLLWNTDGLAGYIRITNGKFSYTNIVGIMIPTNFYDMNSIDLEYLKYYLEPIFRANRKGRFGINGKNEYTKINSTMIKELNIKIPIPIDSNGVLDLEKQKEITQKIATIVSIKQDLHDKMTQLVNIVVV